MALRPRKTRRTDGGGGRQMNPKLFLGRGVAPFPFFEFIFLHADIVLRGYIAWNSRRALQVITKIFPKDSAVQPSLVVVYFGGNDSIAPHPSGLGPHVPLEEYMDNMRKIGEHLKSLSDKTRVIFLSCPPLNEELLKKSTSTALSEIVRTNETCRLYSEACISVSKEMGIKVVDLWNAMQKREDWATACFTDGLHLSEEGSNIVVEEILRILKEAEWDPCLHWKAMPTEFGEDSPYDLVASSGKSTINPSEWTFHRKRSWE
ncbi:unnamed protein product [Triticum turgidum subsp. durum]|uniref:SGNH hydrolase-type esterase domain-containing protein n=1 Tax=Triticum turgidum subsp. durum TaxID=4567 RepID=A0A9R0SC60_TRITD|nr:unnamed protein product [Triticum turgidum subsp. durum]